MDTIVKNVIFNGEHTTEWDGIIGEQVTEQDKILIEEMIRSGHFNPDESELSISKFLEEDRTINVTKLEIATRLIIRYQDSLNKELEIVVGDVVEYCKIRGIELNSSNFREESTFIESIIRAVSEDELSEESEVGTTPQESGTDPKESSTYINEG